MWLLASKRVVLAGLSMAALVLSQAEPALAQEADTFGDAGLQSDTDNTEADVLTGTEQPQTAAPITIGDDEPERIVRRRRAEENPYDPLGLRIGTFTVFPVLEIGAGVSVKDSKAAATDAAAETRLRPSVRAESDWSRHQLTLSGEAALDSTFGNTTTLATQGSIEAALRLDVRRGTTLDLDTRYELKESDANASDSALEHNLTNSVALTNDLGGIEARVRVAASRRLFGDAELSGGGTEDNSDRDYTELSVALRGSLTRGAILTPFAEVAYEPRVYDRKKDRNGIARDSQGLRMTAGLTFADDPIWTGEVAANLLYRTYDDSSLDDAWAPGLSANVTWQPTDLTRFEFNAAVSLEETITASESSTATWSAGYTVTHNLRENLTASAGVSLTKETGGNNTLTLGTDLGLTWALNRNVVLGLNYNGEYRDGSSSQDHNLIGSIILRR
jgi:hypothetical protein